MNNLLDKKPKPWYNILINTIINIVLILVIILFLIVLFISPVNIKGSSMENTVYNGQMVATARFAPYSYSRGDIVVANMTYVGKSKPTFVIKRVIAKEGDSIAFVKNEGFIDLYFYRNGAYVKKEEGYVKEPMTLSKFDSSFINNYIFDSVEEISQPLTLKKGEYFLMGDNRNHSSDSRNAGIVKESDIVSVMLFNISENPFYNFIFTKLFPFSQGETQ